MSVKPLNLICCTSTPANVLENVPSWLETIVRPDDVCLTLELDGVSPEGFAPFLDEAAQSFPLIPVLAYSHPEKLGPVGMLQRGFLHSQSPILGYIHDDVMIREAGWEQRVLDQFDDPSVAVVGFGGATGLGTADIYKTPYRIEQLARQRYASNTDDAEVHGERFGRTRRVAVLDAYSMFVRRSFLESVGGWPTDRLLYHMPDAWLAVMAARNEFVVRDDIQHFEPHGPYKTMLVGVKAQHFGGRTSCRAEWANWLKEKHGKVDQDVHRESHEYIYELGRGILPIRESVE